MVARVVLLDAGPVGLVTNPRVSPQGLACAQWLDSLLAARCRVIIPEIVDYEVRRELLRAEKLKGLKRLDSLCELLEYLPIRTPAMRRAAELWSLARRQGQPTAGDRTIDADMILAGQALTLDAAELVIATTNVGHLNRFVAAALWNDITVR